MSINNIELIKPLLNLTEEGDFVQLYIFKRKKDQLEGEKDNHQSVRTIKSYSVESIEYLEKKMSEVIDLCEMFKARAYIHINKQNHKDIGLLMMEKLANRLRQGVIRQNHIFDSVAGELHSKEKRWIIDIDNTDIAYKRFVIGIINTIEPKDIYEKIVTEIPTKNGIHLITTPFNVIEFNKYIKMRTDEIPDIQKRNPTLLFLPNSLENDNS